MSSPGYLIDDNDSMNPEVEESSEIMQYFMNLHQNNNQDRLKGGCPYPSIFDQFGRNNVQGVGG